MKQILQKLPLFFIIAFVLAGCKSTEQKASDFVKAYNNTAPRIVNQVVTSTSAKVLPKNIVRIEFVLAMTANDADSSIQKQMLPAMAKALVQSERSVQDLIEEGVVFEIALLSMSETPIKEITIDKKKMDEMLSGGDAKTDAGKSKNSHLSSQMQDMLAIMNENLPIIDKEAGTKITKIDVNPEMQLVYTVEVDKALTDAMKNESLRDMMKEEMLRGGDAQRVLGAVARLGVNSLRYIYTDEKGVVLNEVLISQKDFN